MTEEIERRDNSKIYMLLGELKRGLKDQGDNFNQHCNTEDIDRRDLKDGITAINLTLAGGVKCPHKEDIKDNVKGVGTLRTKMKFVVWIGSIFTLAGLGVIGKWISKHL